MLHADFNNDVCHPPYTLTVDHGTRTVVLAVRGTLSTKDLLTDALVSDVPIPAIFRAPGMPVWAHEGLVRVRFPVAVASFLRTCN